MLQTFRPAALLKRDPSTGFFSCKYCKIFNTTYFEKHLQTVLGGFRSFYVVLDRFRSFQLAPHINKYHIYFLKLHIIIYFRASFQHFSNILTSFRRGDFIPTKKQITEILTQIRQTFCERRSKSFLKKLSDFTFAANFAYQKNNLFGTFFFETS